LGYYNNSLFNGIYSSILVFRVAYALYLKVFFRKVSIKKLILALVVFKVVGVSYLVYIGLVGLRGLYKEIFRQRLIVII
jgi:NhaP-type Na+/H+ or K+/H+ antiporter